MAGAGGVRRVAGARPTLWGALVPLVCLVAGIGLAASARDSRGTNLRAPGTANLVDTVRAAENRVHTADALVRRLQRQVGAAAKLAGLDNGGVAAAQAVVAPLRAPAGLVAMRGPGLLVVLDDSRGAPAGVAVDANQLVVHQSDLQAVVNAMWAGGAEAVSVAGQRLIATSAVRCVGNTLLLNGEVYSPPFRVAAIGSSVTMQNELQASPGVRLFREAAGYYGLGYTVESKDRVDVPGYTGSLTISYAHPLR